jgi:NAD(P)-dependent dehydrogenase (short-subunit alcohol dehydrogenase family)
MNDEDKNKESLYTLITGASSGIGQGLAIRLSATRRLILHGRSMQRLQETLGACANPGDHLIWPHELADVAGLAPSLSSLMAEKGIFVECFIHSAGILKLLPIRSVDYKALSEVMNINFFSAVEIISLLVKKRINRQQLKDILLISSIASSFGAPGFSMYSASKGALDSLMRSLSVELAPLVRVNSILPGGLKTPMTETMLGNAEVMEKLERGYPLGIGTIEDIVNAAEFLVSRQSRWVTGQSIIVDGGRTTNISI